MKLPFYPFYISALLRGDVQLHSYPLRPSPGSQEVIDTYQKPVWITEFAPQTIKQSEEKPNRWSQEEVDAFIYQALFLRFIE